MVKYILSQVQPFQLWKTMWITIFSLNLKNNYISCYPTTESISSSSSIKPVSAGNLKLTFGPGEIPEGFFQELGVRRIPTQQDSDKNGTSLYNLCQNGSGGLCVPIGDCPADLKPQESQNTTAFKDDKVVCPDNYECCYGYPEYERSCRLRGGGCVVVSECGNGPKFRDDVECDSGKDEVCCILTN